MFIFLGLDSVKASPRPAGDLFIGAASTSITPEEPVAVSGQFRLRIANKVESPVTANVVVLETREGSDSIDCAAMVSCDLLYTTKKMHEQVRSKVRQALPEFDATKIFLNGTHTHTAPVMLPEKYCIPKDGVMQVEEYLDFFSDQVAEAIVRAWKNRERGLFAYGLSHAVVGQNRRAVYADGSARMYGPTHVPDFRHLEGYEDDDVGVLLFFNADKHLVAMAVNVACPSQEVESRSEVNADFWHQVRNHLKQHFDNDLVVLGWSAPSGDQSPHLMYREKAENRMRNLRGLSRLDEIARRITNAVMDAYEVVKEETTGEVVLTHHVETLELPKRLVLEEEFLEARTAVNTAERKIAADPKTADAEYRRKQWYRETVDRYREQQENEQPMYAMELHVLRLQDVAICTNPFELFTDFGIRIKGRSKATQTFPIQLVGPGTYVPTKKAVEGGHYSAVVHSSVVGPEGGQILVDRTVELINSMF
jgi:hypothetical protein